MLDTKKKFVPLLTEYGKFIFVLVLLVISCVLLCILFALASPKKLEVSFLDVGQGDAILVSTPSGKSMLIDGGASARVLDQLAERLSFFDRTVDVMVATHPDADHITGLIAVLEKYEVKNIVVSPVEGSTKIVTEFDKRVESEYATIHVAKVGDSIDFHDGVIAHILYPSKNFHAKKNETNDASVVLLIMYGDMSFLLTGDLPTTSETKLLGTHLQKKITVYKAGHHGSKYSSGEQLLSYIKPEYSVISAGKNNKYGHPNQEAVSRLQKYSQEVLSTIDRGTIMYQTDGHTLELDTTR